MATVMPEYMRVRKYLYNLISKCDGSDLRIPPENELTRIFGVSRVTVRGAIRGLVKDNLLITLRGLGTFINPDAQLRHSIQFPTIAVLKGDGRSVFAASDPRISIAAKQTAVNEEQVFIPNSDAPERLLELLQNNIAGVIWSTPNPSARPYLDAIHKTGTPLLILGNGFENEFDSIRDAKAERGIQLADYVTGHGHKHILYLHNYDSDQIDRPDAPETTSGTLARRLLEITGEPFDGFMSLTDFERMLCASGLGKYTLLYSDAGNVRPVMDILKKNAVCVPEDVSYLCAWKPAQIFFPGLTPAYIDCDTDEINCINDWILKKIIGHGDEPFLRTPRSTIHDGDTVKNINS